MIALALLTVWAGYGVTSWGWCLVRGYDITFTQWFNPVHPYQWPDGGSPPPVPKGSVFPTGATGGPGIAGGIIGSGVGSVTGSTGIAGGVIASGVSSVTGTRPPGKKKSGK